MFKQVLYFLISLASTTMGSLTGVGGGVVIKPILDALQDYNVSTIGMLSSITVFSMAVVSIIKHLFAKSEIPISKVIFISIGSIFGGIIGQEVIGRLTAFVGRDSVILIAQNIVLALLLLLVLIYMINRQKIKSLELSGVIPSFIAGIFLGTVSSFLGIGGGPINVAAMLFLFSVDMKTASVSSLVIIVFAQVSKLISVAITTGFAGYDLSKAPVLIVGAIVGGFIGASMNKKFSEESVEIAFNGLILVVLGIAIFNIIRNLTII